LVGSLVALGTVAVLLAAVVTSGVTVSALTNSTILGIAILWIVLYGGGYALSLVSHRFSALDHLSTPDQVLLNMPQILRGYYNLESLGRLVGYSALASLLVAVVGMMVFSRRDV
jgi:hypothetical protein